MSRSRLPEASIDMLDRFRGEVVARSYSPAGPVFTGTVHKSRVRVPVKRHRREPGHVRDPPWCVKFLCECECVSVCDFCHGKETPGVAGTHKGQWDTQGTHARAQTGTRITQTNLTTIQTHKHTRTAIQTVKPVDLCWGYMLAKQNPLAEPRDARRVSRRWSDLSVSDRSTSAQDPSRPFPRAHHVSQNDSALHAVINTRPKF